MVFLTSCWFIIEKVIVPDGYVKWFCLSYFIYPPLLVFVQMILLLQKLTKFFLVTVSCLVRFCCSVCEYVLRPVRCLVVYVQSLFSAVCDEDQYFDTIEIVDNEEDDTLASSSSLVIPRGHHMAEDDDAAAEEMFEETWDMPEYATDQISLHEEITVEDFDEDAGNNEVHSENDNINPEEKLYPNVELDSQFSYSPLDPIQYPSIDFLDSPIEEYSFLTNGYFPSTTDLNSSTPKTELSEQSDDPTVNSSIDPFYMEYTEKMRWYDMLNHDRNSAMGSVKKTGNPLESSISFKAIRRGLLRSLEYEFEMIYVAQLCLSWEALHHQYRMVEAYLANSSTQHGFFYTNVAGEFQRFHVHLNRFMEDEWMGEKRYLNYVQRRFSDKSFLQVPQLSGFYEEAKHGTMGEAMNDGRQVLKAIEECVKTYCEFVKTDRKYSWWKLKHKIWTHLPVDDPRNLDFLAKLSRLLQLKELFLKDLTGKKRCWCSKRVTTVHVGDFEARKELLFSMINLKLVRRVLDLYVVTTPQLNWCKDKLDSVVFMGGSVATISFIRPMFPP